MKTVRGWLTRGGWAVMVVTLFMVVTLVPVAAWAEPTMDGGSTSAAGLPAELFSVHCVGCHPNGGNIIRRGKTLKARALNRNGYTDLDGIAQIITNGKGVMSAYRELLTPTEIQTLASYVLEQADHNWQE